VTVAEIQISRKIVLGIVVMLSALMFAFGDASQANGTPVHDALQWLGLVAIIICIFGRTWTSLYIAGRKRKRLVIDGPYSITRNPLYFFSTLGAAGAGAQLGSVTMVVVIGLLVWFVFYLEILHEERELTAGYGQEYEAYKSLVPQFLPNPRLWREPPTLTIQLATVRVTFIDSLLFLLSAPLADVLEQLRRIGVLPVLFQLP
jgi:protein-S-isoprenylcysteine O-methyltransferase Ste14